MWVKIGSYGELFNSTQDASLDYNLINCVFSLVNRL